MSKVVFTTKPEFWNVSDGNGGRQNVLKVATRDRRGRFEGATNRNGTVLRVV
jgi:hypothetical protein